MPFCSRRFGVGLLAAVAGGSIVACAQMPPRAPVRDDEALLGQLGFIRGERVDRTLIEARLGEPVARYENGRVVSYAVYSSHGRLTLQPRGDCFALMIEYAPDGSMARHELIRHGSALCVK